MAAIWLRLFDLQILRYRELSQRAKRQQERTIEVAPRRGNIYDRNFHELAMTVQMDSVFASPTEMRDLDAAATLLSPILQMEPAALRTRFQNGKAFSWVKRRVDAADAARVRALNLRGIYLEKEPVRVYPKAELAAHVLGFVTYDQHGAAGLESKFNRQVEGQ